MITARKVINALILWSFMLPATQAAEITKEPWETGLQWAGGLLILCDYAQTQQIRHTEGIKEINPISVRFLGEQPNSRKVNQWFALQALGYWFIQEYAPRDTRNVVNFFIATTRFGVVQSNERVGLGIDLHIEF